MMCHLSGKVGARDNENQKTHFQTKFHYTHAIFKVNTPRDLHWKYIEFWSLQYTESQQTSKWHIVILNYLYLIETGECYVSGDPLSYTGNLAVSRFASNCLS